MLLYGFYNWFQLVSIEHAQTVWWHWHALETKNTLFKSRRLIENNSFSACLHGLSQITSFFHGACGYQCQFCSVHCHACSPFQAHVLWHDKLELVAFDRCNCSQCNSCDDALTEMAPQAHSRTSCFDLNHLVYPVYHIIIISTHHDLCHDIQEWNGVEWNEWKSATRIWRSGVTLAD